MTQEQTPNPNQKSPDEIRVEKLRKMIEEASASNIEAMAKLEALKRTGETKSASAAVSTPSAQLPADLKERPKKINLPPKPEGLESPPLGGATPPKEERVRINLPPKPLRPPTIKLPTLPPAGPVLETSSKTFIFTYKAMDKNRREVKGRIEARDQNQAIQRIKEMDLLPTSLIREEDVNLKNVVSSLEHQLSFLKQNLALTIPIIDFKKRKRIKGEILELQDKIEREKRGKQARETLAVIQEGETESSSTAGEEKVNLPDGKKASWLKRKKWLPIGLATGLAVGGGYWGGKKLGWWGSGPAPAREKAERKSDTDGATNEIYKIPAETNLTALAREATNAAPALETNAPKVGVESTNTPPSTLESTSTNQPPALTIEQLKAKIQAGFEEELEKKQAEIDAMKARLAVIEKEKSKKPTSSAKPIEKNLGEMTDAEFLAHIRAKLNKGIDINEAVETGVNAMRWNRLIQQERN